MNNDKKDLFDLTKFHRYEETETLDPNRSRGLTLSANENDAIKTEATLPIKLGNSQSQITRLEESSELAPEVIPNTPEPNVDQEKIQKNAVIKKPDNAATLGATPPLYSSSKIGDANPDFDNYETDGNVDQPRQLAGKTKAKKSGEKNTLKEIATFLLPTVIALLIALGLRGFVFTNTTVPTGSMLNTIEIGSRLIGSKLSYSFGKDPQRYDIVIFKYPDNEKQEYVKRVIGLPGETVEIIDGKVYINGSKTPLKDNFVTTGTPKGNYGPYKVPNGSYFMLGDNRGNSNDSRFWENQFVKEEKIIAKVVFQYYPSFEKIK